MTTEDVKNPWHLGIDFGGGPDAYIITMWDSDGHVTPIHPLAIEAAQSRPNEYMWPRNTTSVSVEEYINHLKKQ